MKNTLLFLTAAFLVTGCHSKKKKTADPSTGQITTTNRATRPDTIKTTIAVEGIPQSMQMYRLESADSFPLKFSTYIPVDMKTEVVHRDGGPVIRLMAHFGGQLNKEARLLISAFPAETPAAAVRKEAMAKARTLGTISKEPDRYPWAKKVYAIEGKKIGFLALAHKNDRWFYLLAAYPPEYGDGMGPRIHEIIRHWRWKDGRRLSVAE